MSTPSEILDRFQLFRCGTAGIGQWLTDEKNPVIMERLAMLDSKPLSKVQLNQLLVLGHEAPVSFGFFTYYWLTTPQHCYDVRHLCKYDTQWIEQAKESHAIVSVDHFFWGLHRIFTDGLLFFGNVRSAFRTLRGRTEQEIQQFFTRKRFDTDKLLVRGPALPMMAIGKDDRYLISEMACKSFGANPITSSDLGNILAEALAQHLETKGGAISIRALLAGDVVLKRYKDKQTQLVFSADDVLEQQVSSMEELLAQYQRLARKFDVARAAAIKNTHLYLSMVSELDVYVATSMRSRADFREMADTCDRVFSDPVLVSLNLRYFDPTLSAAEGHEDKGLIECLMVKCAKLLLYCAGIKESYGKDAEAAMALSLGKPVIFYCDEKQKATFYRDVHPLSRLIEFETGVAVGAIVTDELAHVVELVRRVCYNAMEYVIEQHPARPGYIRLKEKLTGSIIRLHTDDRLLAETFWNHYNERRRGEEIVARF